jgi:uncharacterized protein
VTVQPAPRVVFDTNVVLAALLFRGGRLAWLRAHWQQGGCVPLISHTTAMELTRVLAYSRFHLGDDRRVELLGLYVPCCEDINPLERCAASCRDAKDQPFLDLAHCGKADVLVTGDEDLLALAGHTSFVIEMPEAYRHRAFGESI